MMRLSPQFDNLPILSLHAGHALGQVTGLLVNPHKLLVIGFWCQLNREDAPRLLLTQSVRDMSKRGLIINHEEDVCEPEELVRFQEIIDINYEVIGKRIVTESKQRLGKVIDFVIDDVSWRIAKLHAQRPAWKAFVANAFTIDRNQILSVNDQAIIVRDGTVPIKAAKKVVPLPELTPAA